MLRSSLRLRSVRRWSFVASGVPASRRLGIDSQSGRRECPFSVLGLARGATKDEVRRRYKELAKVHHPDAGGDERTFRSLHDAYDECLDRIDSGRAQDTGEEWNNFRRTAQREAAGDWGTPEHRERVRAVFEETSEPDAVDALLDECLRRGYFAAVDAGEPLRLALSRYHTHAGLGLEHLARCLDAMSRWEEATRRVAPCEFYHTVLVLYTNEAYLGHLSDASVITEVVTRVIERMEERGLAVDDWTMTLANRTFRTLPFPDW